MMAGRANRHIWTIEEMLHRRGYATCRTLRWKLQEWDLKKEHPKKQSGWFLARQTRQRPQSLSRWCLRLDIEDHVNWRIA